MKTNALNSILSAFQPSFLPKLLTAVALFCSAQAAEAKPDDYTQNLKTYRNCKTQKRAVVVGTSVTLGFYGDSPVMLYLRQAGFKDQCIWKKSYPIGDSEEHFQWLQNAVKDFKPNIIFALDYLIHDVTFTHEASEIPERMRASGANLDYLGSLDIPVVMGSVFAPRSGEFPFQNELSRLMNQKMCEIAEKKSNFYILPIAQIYYDIYNNNFRLPEIEERLSKFEVLVDMYHPGPRGAHMLSNVMTEYLNELNDQGLFPYHAKMFDTKWIFNLPFTRPFLQQFNQFAHEKTLFQDGELTLLMVNPTTIPADVAECARPKNNPHFPPPQ